MTKFESIEAGTGEKKLLPERQGPSAAFGLVNNALAKARDHVRHTIHPDYVHQVLIGFDLAADAARDALRVGETDAR